MRDRRLAPVPSSRLVARADDGFWTAANLGFDEANPTALAAVPVFNPKAAGSPAPAPAPVFTVTSVVKVVRPVTVTEVVVVEPTVTAVVVTATSTLELPVPVETVTFLSGPSSFDSAVPNEPEKVFGGASSSAYVRVVSLASASSSAEPPASARSRAEASSLAGPQPASSAYTPILVIQSSTSGISERVFAPPTQSQVRAVVTSTAQAGSPLALTTSSSSSSTSANVPATTSSPSASSSSPSTTASGEDGTSSDIGGSSAVATSTVLSGGVDGTGLARTDLVSPTSTSSSSARHPTRSSSILGVPEATGSSSVFSHLGDSPANIALTTLVCFAIIAALAALPVFCLCRRRRRRRQDRLGHALGSDGGSPSMEEGWPVRSPSSARWTPPPHLGEPWSPSGELGEQVRQMRELWRETALGGVEVATEFAASEEATAGPGTTAAAEGGRSPATETSEWTSWVGGHASTDGHGSVGYFDPSGRRGSDATVTPEVLERRSRVALPHGLGAQPHGLGAPRQVRAPHPLRTAMRPEDFSPSTYSPSSGHPSQRSPAYPSSGLGSPFSQRAPAKPLWRESLDRVMNAAADLISTTHLSRASADGGSRRGSLTRPFVAGGLRRALAARKADEELLGDKTLLDEKRGGEDGGDRRSFDWFASYLGPRAPLVGSSVASSVADIERPVSPPSPLLGYAPSTATVVPPRPAHVRAPSSTSIYDARPEYARALSALPPTFLSVAEDDVDPFDSTHARAHTPPPPFARSPALPPRTPTPFAAVALAPIQASPAPFSQLEPAAAVDPFADPPPSPPSSPLVVSPSSTLDATPPSPSPSSSPSSPTRSVDHPPSDADETLSTLAHHAAFAQLHLLRRTEARTRRSSTSGASPLVGLRTRFVREREASASASARARPASVAVCGSAPACEVEQSEDEQDDDDDVSSLALSAWSTASTAGAERQRLALERERAAVLMRERRRRSLCGAGAGSSSWRGSLVGREDSDGGCTV
ncbi:hypothetical protein JCM3775_001403 [Rhodotorula graminis]